MTSFVDELKVREERLESVKRLYDTVDKYVDKRIDTYKFHDFRNNLRKKLSTGWEQGVLDELIEIKYKNDYIEHLEKMLFDLLKDKPE